MHAQYVIISTLVVLGLGSKAMADVERKNPNHAGIGLLKSTGLKEGKSPVFSPSAYWYFYGGDGWRSSIGFEKRYSAADPSTRSLSILTQSFLREERIWSDVYWGAGFEFMLLYPTIVGQNPFQKDPDHKTEFGIGANIHLLEHFSPEKTMEIKFSKWRGVGSRNYQGFSFALIFSHSIKERDSD